MLNENCINDIMLYLESNLTRKPSGKFRGIKSKIIMENLPNEYSLDDFYTSLSYLVEIKLLTRTNPQHTDASVRAYKINGITAKGQDYLNLIHDDTQFHKVRKSFTFEKIMQAFSTGVSILELLHQSNQST
ncbi:DUF2513 domain-containing protein [Anaerotignum lactatifermentans]|uniref:DUF2513 domain-containing protein n=1 Tax=Anaerotignum lactatifermentans TaxID=160404 RepID=UPI00174A96C8|nr:DUF2513 domain-containing protein [Anaerotignum lactatifermentans]